MLITKAVSGTLALHAHALAMQERPVEAWFLRGVADALDEVPIIDGRKPTGKELEAYNAGYQAVMGARISQGI